MWGPDFASSLRNFDSFTHISTSAFTIVTKDGRMVDQINISLYAKLRVMGINVTCLFITFFGMANLPIFPRIFAEFALNFQK